MAITDPFADDKLHEECGIFGIVGHVDSSAHAALGLHALQHRGQEAAGIVSYDGRLFHSHRGLGHVSDNFGNRSAIDALPGDAAIGHVRYATSGNKTILRNVQPIFAELSFGGVAIAHNGNLTNAKTLRKRLVRQGCIFQSEMDTEVITHLMATSRHRDVIECLVDALLSIEGAYALLMLTQDKLVGARDPYGVRPLILGELDGAPILTSETCALDILGATFIRDIEPGEVVILDREGVESIKPFRKTYDRFCIFEYIYFARPSGLAVGGRPVGEPSLADGPHRLRAVPPTDRLANGKAELTRISVKGL